MAKQDLRADNEIFVLPKKKIQIKPVIWGTSWLSLMGGKGHSMAWKQDNAKLTFQIPVDGRTGALVEPLTELERKYFESDKCPLGYKAGELLANVFVTDNRNNKILKSFWTKYSYTIRKSASIIDEDTVLDTLDLSNPKDYLNYVVLRANTSLVAPNPESKYHNGKYVVVLVDEGEDEVVKASKTDRIAEAYAHYSALSQRAEKMRELLTIAYFENLNKVKPAQDASTEWLKTECNKLIQLDYGQTYLKVVKNKYEDKAFLFKCIDKGAVTVRKDGYATNDGTWLGATLAQTITYIADPRNTEMLIKLQAQVER